LTNSSKSKPEIEPMNKVMQSRIGYIDPNLQDKRGAEQGKRAAVIAMAVNGLLSIIKLLAGLIFGSMAVLADGADSFFDIITSISVFVGIKASEKPPDAEHLYGHGRFEDIPGLVVAGTLIIAATGILFEAVRKVMLGEYIAFQWIVLCAALLSIGGKYQLQRYLFDIAERIKSMSLRSYAQNIRGDVLTSTSVTIGVTASALGAPWADPLVAILVAALIFKTGVGVMVETLHILTDRSPGPEAVSKIYSIVVTVPGVKSCHKVRARMSGRKVFVDLHVEVDPGIEVATSHRISDAVIEAVRKSDSNVDSVLVHIEPSPQIDDVRGHLKESEDIKTEVMKVGQVKGCHQIRLQHVGGKMVAEMHILVDPRLSISETHRISEEVSKRVKSRFPNIAQVVIHEEPESEGAVEG